MNRDDRRSCRAMVRQIEASFSWINRCLGRRQGKWFRMTVVRDSLEMLPMRDLVVECINFAVILNFNRSRLTHGWAWTTRGNHHSGGFDCSIPDRTGITWCSEWHLNIRCFLMFNFRRRSTSIFIKMTSCSNWASLLGRCRFCITRHTP